jgi:capsular polysaccharide biosynthesis protein
MTVPRIRVLRALRRRAWVIVVAVALCAAAAAVLSGARSSSYTSSSLLLVGSGASAKGPGDASEAINLASTYATLLPQDPGVTRYVGKRLGKSASDVEDALSASHLTGTGLITLTFKDDDADTAVKGAALTVRAVTGTAPTSASIGPDSLTVVRAPSHDQGFSKKQTISPSASLALAIIFGLFLGIIIMIAWERADPRIDEPGDVELAAHLPASRLRDLSGSARAALVQRLAGQARPSRCCRPAASRAPTCSTPATRCGPRRRAPGAPRRRRGSCSAATARRSWRRWRPPRPAAPGSSSPRRA